MKLLILDDSQQQYLLHVFTSYCHGGLPPDQLAIAATTYQSLVTAREVPIETHLGKADLAVGPNGIALELKE